VPRTEALSSSVKPQRQLLLRTWPHDPITPPVLPLRSASLRIRRILNDCILRPPTSHFRVAKCFGWASSSVRLR
jgi:hypothetical protein